MRDHDAIPLPDYQELPLDEMRARLESFRARMATRRSVRAFSDRAVPRDLIETAIRVAASAPNGANLQPWHFSVIGDPALKRRIREGAEEEERYFYAGRAGQEWLDAVRPLGTTPVKPYLEIAPWLICIFGARRSRDLGGALHRNYYVPESVSIATGFLIAALHQAGLATLTHTPSPMGFLNEICGRSRDEKPYMILVTGYPAADATIPRKALEKKPFDEIATFHE